MAKKVLYPHVPKSKMPNNIYEGGAPPSAWAAEIARRKEEAYTLLRQAVAEVESENFESALWRAVDAAGLMSFFVHRNAVGMPPNPTGRGFFISKKKD